MKAVSHLGLDLGAHILTHDMDLCVLRKELVVDSIDLHTRRTWGRFIFRPSKNRLPKLYAKICWFI